MKRVLGIVAVVLAVVLVGCTQHNPEIARMAMNFGDGAMPGSNNMYVQAFVVKADNASLTTANDQRPNTNPDLNLGLDGGAASSAGAAEGLMKVLSTVTQKVEDKVAKQETEDKKPEVQKPEQKPEDDIVETEGKVIGSASYRGLTNGGRPTWYFNEKADSLKGKDLVLKVPGMEDVAVKKFNGSRFEKGTLIIKQSDVAGRGIAVLIPKGSPEPEKITIEY